MDRSGIWGLYLRLRNAVSKFFIVIVIALIYQLWKAFKTLLSNRESGLEPVSEKPHMSSGIGFLEDKVSRGRQMGVEELGGQGRPQHVPCWQRPGESAGARLARTWSWCIPGGGGSKDRAPA